MEYLVHHMLQNSAWRAADQEALVCGNQRLDYATLAQRVTALAYGLTDLGLVRGDRVAVYLRPSVALPLSLFAVSQADGVFVPIHHGLFPDQVAHILRDSGAKALISDGRRWQSLEGILPQTPELEFAVVEDGVSPLPPRPTHDLDSLCQQTRSAVTEKCIEKDLAAILYTSGSTGRPKGVMLSHANVLAGAAIVSQYLKITAQDRILAALPLSFDAGLNQLTTAVMQGGTTVMIEFRFGRDIVQQLLSERITGLAGVPSLWSLLAQPSSGLGKQPIPDLRYITNTGGAMPQNVLAQLRTLLPHTKVFLMYGLTEAFRSTYLPPEELDRRPTSIGKAIPNTEILVLNEAGQSCAAGEVGELIHHGPTVSLGYWGHSELTDRVLRPHPFPPAGRVTGDLVCYSGDLVRRDEDGFLYFVGRRDNQIKSAGFRISPTEVEEVICQVAAVRQAAVVGVPDPVLGQHLVAFAVPDERAQLEPANILAQCAGALPRHMVPKRVELVSELPMTSSGKVDYPRLLRSRGVRSRNKPHRHLVRRREGQHLDHSVRRKYRYENEKRSLPKFSNRMSSRLSASKNQPESTARQPRDHAARIINQYFSVREAELCIGGLPVSQLVEEFGTPLFVYDQGVMLRKIQDIRAVLPTAFGLFYSIKANPNAAVLKCFLNEGCGLEVASAGELFQALEAGCPPRRLIFAGPGKTPLELAAALKAAIREIHIESIDEARCLNTLAEDSGQVATIALRVNPIEASGGAMRMGGRAAPFGIDEEDLDQVLSEILALQRLNVVGVHLFMATQILDAETLIEQYHRALSIARQVARRIPGPLKTIDFGGGLGTAYFAHETELDLAQVASGLATVAQQMKDDPLLAVAEGILEPGRFLVNESGVYLAKVTRVKESRGKTFVVIDGGMHHHLAASGNLGQTIKRNYPVAILNKLGRQPTRKVEVVGPLCTPLDMLARQADLPLVQAGDLFGVFQSGAYARTSSPLGFLSHNSPAEVMVTKGKAALIRRGGEPADFLRDQCQANHGIPREPRLN